MISLFHRAHVPHHAQRRRSFFDSSELAIHNISYPKEFIMRSLRLSALAAAAALTSLHLSAGFAPSSSIAFANSRTTELWSETQQPSSLISTREGIPNLTGALENCELHEFILTDHKPLGCSVEESLASEPDGTHFVFVSEVRYIC